MVSRKDTQHSQIHGIRNLLSAYFLQEIPPIGWASGKFHFCYCSVPPLPVVQKIPRVLCNDKGKGLSYRAQNTVSAPTSLGSFMPVAISCLGCLTIQQPHPETLQGYCLNQVPARKQNQNLLVPDGLPFPPPTYSDSFKPFPPLASGS